MLSSGQVGELKSERRKKEKKRKKKEEKKTARKEIGKTQTCDA